MVAEIKCEEVLREISNYVDGEIDAELRARMEAHFKECARCLAVLDGTRNVVLLIGDDRAFDVPPGLSKRLYRKLEQRPTTTDVDLATDDTTVEEISLGITEQKVKLGSHLVYFWQTDAEFERGTRFLREGLRGRDYCVVFGHDEANAKVCKILASAGFNVSGLKETGRLTILRRQLSAPATLGSITALFQAAVRAGVPAIRFLGNLGMGQQPLPDGAADVLELEARVTSTAQRFPCVVVCMYDVNTLPGRIVLQGGFQTHSLAVCGDELRQNPYYVPAAEFLRGLKHVQ
jgi:hypothetical protein